MQNFDDYQNFEAKVAVHRIEDRGVFVAEVAIRCLETGEVMEVDDETVPAGASINRTMQSVFGHSLSFPIRPPRFTKGVRWDELCSGPDDK